MVESDQKRESQVGSTSALCNNIHHPPYVPNLASSDVWLFVLRTQKTFFEEKDDRGVEIFEKRWTDYITLEGNESKFEERNCFPFTRPETIEP